jgi:hypothetical protein
LSEPQSVPQNGNWKVIPVPDNESYHYGVLIAGIERKLYLEVVMLSTIDVHAMVPAVGQMLWV